MTNVQEYKKKIVNDMTKLMIQYKIIGMVNMEDMPAPQLQSMRSELRGKVNLFMTKKRFMKIAIEKVKNEKKNVEKLNNYFEGMPALLFTNESPFKLSKILKKSKTKAPAKAGQIAPSDIIIHKGPTPFAPGPVISELSAAGLKVGVENGKVAVKEDTVVAKKGEKIKPKIAEILARLDIKPMEIGLGLVAAYEDGIIYEKDILDVDEQQYLDNINLAAAQAFNLAFNTTYITKENISLLLGKAFMDSKAIGLSQNIIDEGIIDDLLAKAEMSMQSLKSTAKIETKVPETKKEQKPEIQEKETKPEVPEKEIKQEPKVEEKKVEIPPPKEKVEEEKPQEKEDVKPEPKVEEQKPEPKPIEPIQEIKKEIIIKQKVEVPIEKKEESTDDKIQHMVENVKKFVEGTEETADDILDAVKKDEALEQKKEDIKEKKSEEKVPSAHDLIKKKEDVSDKEKDEQKEVEELTKELIKKGTLRK